METNGGGLLIADGRFMSLSQRQSLRALNRVKANRIGLCCRDVQGGGWTGKVKGLRYGHQSLSCYNSPENLVNIIKSSIK